MTRFSCSDLVRATFSADLTCSRSGCWYCIARDPKSSLEAQFLQQLYESRRRLPDRAQYRPEDGVYCETDFFYERDGLNGVAVFIDGPSHDDPAQKQKDVLERAKLDDLGYRVLAIRYDRSIEEQLAENPDIFGLGAKTAATRLDPLRERYVETAKQYQALINRKYRSGLSAAEHESLAALERALDDMDKTYYDELLRHLQTLVEKKEASS